MSQPAELDTPVDTTDGRRSRASRSETGDCNDVMLSIGEGENQDFFTFAPSHARNLGRQLIDSADGIDNDYPNLSNR
ncbi:hypothetical protein OPAG_06822 [Rhodococcus opacus PD630]|uniref:hypothetical protein n=1 Tax=Rhodococcus opacus TaxID=37919 RepID=UPI00029CB157|nr:hypothetical protein [Rhodococcus opacus]AHK36011.1 hypothetical protein Pd630_LPD16052 [Rhodococcus opacus PD630]EHI43543.1 hypothetical protein OPAG_06822 [Rhodococcus opacus PD630]UDH01308.1 hypothetical protein K2Z90_007793 [Rhodococcus opacus PD630]